MSFSQKSMNISSMVIQCGGLASVMESALGPLGRAVLLERSGNVSITRDGLELLTLLAVEDPIVNMVTRGVVNQSRLIGDGCKRTMLLLRCLLQSLDYHLTSDALVAQAVRRQKMLQVIHYLRKYLLSDIQKKVFEIGVQVHPLHNFEALGEILCSAADNFFFTKFSKLICGTLSQLFRSYLLCQCSSSDDAVKLLENGVNNIQTTIVEVYNMPLLKSSISPGFVVTRDFKHFDKGMMLDNVLCILWSIELEENNGQVDATIEASNHTSLLESLMMRNSELTRCLSMLKSFGVLVIFSSVYFPDWAVLQCKKHGMSVIDMIDSDEWNFMIRKFQLSPVTSPIDIKKKYVGTVSRVERITLGNSHFIRLHGLNVYQIILCGPTVSQCKQYSSAFHKLFRYLHNWIIDCLILYKSLNDKKNSGTDVDSDKYDFHHITAMSSHSSESNVSNGINSYLLTSNPLPLFYSVSPGNYLPLLAKYLVLEDYVDVDRCKKLATLVIVDVLNEIPVLLHKKSRPSQDKFIDYNLKFDSCCKKLRDTDCYLLKDLLRDMKLHGTESPFVFFRILDSVFTFAQSILRIENIIPSKSRLAPNVDQELEDNEEI